MQQDFLPSDDTGRLHGQHPGRQRHLLRPDGGLYSTQVVKIVDADPNVEGVLGQMEGANGSAGTNSARLMMIVLKPLSQRKSTAGRRSSADLRPKAVAHSRRQCLPHQSAHHPLGARMARSTYQYTLQGLDLAQLQDVFRPADGRSCASMPAFVDVNTDYDAAMPSVQVKIDRDRAAAFGVSPQQIETALGSAFGGQQISQINTSSNQYQVILELLPQYPAQRHRAGPALHHLARSGTLVPLTAVTTMTRRHHAAQRQPFRPGAGRHHLLRPGARQGAVATR